MKQTGSLPEPQKGVWVINYISSTQSVVSFLPYLHIYSQNKSALFVCFRFCFICFEKHCLSQTFCCCDQKFLGLFCLHLPSQSLFEGRHGKHLEAGTASRSHGREGGLLLACSGLFWLVQSALLNIPGPPTCPGWPDSHWAEPQYQQFRKWDTSLCTGKFYGGIFSIESSFSQMILACVKLT